MHRQPRTRRRTPPAPQQTMADAHCRNTLLAYGVVHTRKVRHRSVGRVADVPVSIPMKYQTAPAWPAPEPNLDAVIIIDAGKRVVHWTKGAERLFGCRVSEAVNSPIERFVRGISPTDDPERNGGAGRNATGVRADGVEFPIDLERSALETPGSPMHVLCIRHAETMSYDDGARDRQPPRGDTSRGIACIHRIEEREAAAACGRLRLSDGHR